MEDIQYLLYISSLVKKRRAGTISTGQQEELDRWIAAVPGRAGYLEAIDKEAASMDIDHPIFKVNVLEGIAAIREKTTDWEITRTKRRRRLWQFATAAAIISGIALGVQYIPSRQQREPVPVTVADRPAGSTKARLLLADGSSLELGASRDTAFRQGTAVQVTQKGGALSYYAGEDASRYVQYNTLITPRGGEYHLTLEDGTGVWLNAGSSLRFPVRFSGKTRRVELTGEAFFDVAQQPGQPFIVGVAGSDIVALGTSFNIKAYAGEKGVEATLVTGKAKVVQGSAERLLNPGYTATGREGRITVEKANVAAVTAWKNGLFLFKRTPVAEVMQQVSRWYDVEVRYAPDFDPATYFSGTISRKVPLSKLLEMMEMVGTARLTVTGKVIMVKPNK